MAGKECLLRLSALSNRRLLSVLLLLQSYNQIDPLNLKENAMLLHAAILRVRVSANLELSGPPKFDPVSC